MPRAKAGSKKAPCRGGTCPYESDSSYTSDCSDSDCSECCSAPKKRTTKKTTTKSKAKPKAKAKPKKKTTTTRRRARDSSSCSCSDCLESDSSFECPAAPKRRGRACSGC